MDNIWLRLNRDDNINKNVKTSINIKNILTFFQKEPKNKTEEKKIYLYIPDKNNSRRDFILSFDTKNRKILKREIIKWKCENSLKKINCTIT